ncbi:MAG: hypothetical protein H8E44_33315 [Planctomycetes bacterium]|nr:hypothetical protein [Planctomycetota bacterium]MBL7038197.1 hypothetical protein [Pirellulaceae bacterium]
MRMFRKTLAVAMLASSVAGFTPSVYAGLGSCPLGIVAQGPFSRGPVVEPRVHGGLGGTPLGMTNDLRSNGKKRATRQTVEDEFKVEKGELCPEMIELMYILGIWR